MGANFTLFACMSDVCDVSFESEVFVGIFPLLFSFTEVFSHPMGK